MDIPALLTNFHISGEIFPPQTNSKHKRRDVFFYWMAVTGIFFSVLSSLWVILVENHFSLRFGVTPSRKLALLFKDALALQIFLALSGGFV